MAPITHSIEIDRAPEDVFAYLDDLERHREWQSQIVSSELLTPGPTQVGTRCTDVRKAGGRELRITYEITEHSPPRSFAFRGVDGPVRPVGRGTVEPVDDGRRSRVTIELEMKGHGLMGQLMAPMARSQAKKQVPQDHQRLKEHLESAGAEPTATSSEPGQE